MTRHLTDLIELSNEIELRFISDRPKSALPEISFSFTFTCNQCGHTEEVVTTHPESLEYLEANVTVKHFWCDGQMESPKPLKIEKIYEPEALFT